MLPGSVDPALAASMLSAGFGAEQPGRLDDQGALHEHLCSAKSLPTSQQVPRHRLAILTQAYWQSPSGHKEQR